MDMPDGASIFETTGAWEDFATPSRDLRLLIAIDVVRDFPDRVARRPERYAMPKDKSVADVKAELESHARVGACGAQVLLYAHRRLAMDAVAQGRASTALAELEMAYNVNDCVELRWGAPEGSEEASTCKRHAPASQRPRWRRNTAPGSTSAAARRGGRIQMRRIRMSSCLARSIDLPFFHCTFPFASAGTVALPPLE